MKKTIKTKKIGIDTALTHGFFVKKIEHSDEGDTGKLSYDERWELVSTTYKS
jgi:hypothetical protein